MRNLLWLMRNLLWLMRNLLWCQLQQPAPHPPVDAEQTRHHLIDWWGGPFDREDRDREDLSFGFMRSDSCLPKLSFATHPKYIPSHVFVSSCLFLRHSHSSVTLLHKKPSARAILALQPSPFLRFLLPLTVQYISATLEQTKEKIYQSPGAEFTDFSEQLCAGSLHTYHHWVRIIFSVKYMDYQIPLLKNH